MPLPSFTVTGNLFDLIGNLDGSELVGNGLGGGVPASVTFTSNVPKNHFVTYGGAGYRVQPVVAQVKSDGTLHRNGEPVMLLANDPGLSVTDLQWRVDIVGMEPFWFNAPTDGGTIDIDGVAPVPNVSVVGLPSLSVSGLSDATNYTKTFLTTVDNAGEARDYIGVSLVGLDEIEWFTNFAAFPVTGTADVVYGARDTGKLYLWTGSSYVAARASVTSTDITDSTTTGRAVVTAVDAAAARDAIIADPVVGRGNSIVFMGDSMTARGAVPRKGDFGSIELGGLTQMILARVPSLRYIFNAGVSGEDTNQMIARWTTDVVAKVPTVLHLLGGANDITGGVPQSTTLTNLRWMVQQAKKIGCTVFLGTIPPRNDTDLALDNIDRLNVGIKNLASVEGAHLIDYHAALVDPANGHYLAGLTDDLVHPNATGNKALANLAAAVMNRVLPQGGLPVAAAQYTGQPNRIPNCCFLTDTNADGVADFWTLTGTATTSTASLVTDPDFIGKAQQLTFTGANNLNVTMAITNAVWSIGNRIAFCGKYKAIGVEAGSAVFTIGLAFNASTETNYTKLRPVNASSNVDTDGVGYFYVEDVIPAGTNLIYVQMNAISGSGTLLMGQLGLWVLNSDGTAA